MPLLRNLPPDLKAEALHLLEQILRRATAKKASDLHLKADLPPVVRVNGALYFLPEESGKQPTVLPLNTLEQIVASIFSERQADRYENGEEIDLGMEVPGCGRFRINVCQQRSKPRMVCRYIPDQVRTVEELGLPKAVGDFADASRGLVLVTGATGSGKSTTLAAIIDKISRTRSCHILTIEDPIEFVFRDRKSIVTQREVGVDTGNYGRALKYALRQDPDVILVGEMRDQETILMALNAAETGHLVLSTLHTNDAAETVNRILGTVEPGMQEHVRTQLASVLVGAVSQRLVRRRESRGRIAALEVLVANQRIRDMILDPAKTGELHRAMEEGASVGMQTFDISLMHLVKQGLIAPDEAMRHCSNLADFQLRLQGVTGGAYSNPGAARAATERAANPQDPEIEIEGLSDPTIQRR